MNEKDCKIFNKFKFGDIIYFKSSLNIYSIYFVLKHTNSNLKVFVIHHCILKKYNIYNLFNDSNRYKKLFILNPNKIMNYNQLNTLLKTTGGFTFDTNKNKILKKEPVYVLSPYKDKEKNLGGTIPKEEDYQTYIEANPELSNPSIMLGGWADSGRYFLDVVKLYPKSKYSEEEMKKLAQKYDQETYFDMEKGEVIKV